MPRETIRRFAQDLERVLIAGAHLAAGDAALAQDRAALDGLAKQLGAKAPAIAQLAASAAKLAAAPEKDAARELLGLATSVSQVCRAQAQPAPVGASTDLPPVPEIGTPCNAKDLGELYDALVESGKGRHEIIHLAIERGDIADLRLVDALVFAMGDTYVGEMVMAKAIPRLGPAIVAPIRASLDLARGRTVDGRRLRALVAVQKAEARDLLAAALAAGKAEIREAAFHAIADHVRGEPEFAAAVLEAAQKERTQDVRRAALRALAGYASDAALDALLDGLDRAGTRAAAAEALGACPNPRARDAMLERLATAVTAARVAAKQKPAKSEGDDAAVVTSLLHALARQKDPRIAAVAVDLIDEFGAPAASAVLGSGDAKQLARVADHLEGKDADLFPIAARAAKSLGADEMFRRFTAVFSLKDRAKETGESRLANVTSLLRDVREPRWVDFCLRMLREEAAGARHVIPLLGSWREPRAVEPLRAIIAREKDEELLAPAILALGALRDSASIEPILAHHAHKDWSVHSAVHDAILQIDDPAALEPVRRLFATFEDPRRRHLRSSLLEFLERRFPGK